MIKGGGLAWLLWQEGGVVNSVVELGSPAVSGSTEKEEGGEIVNMEQTKHHKT